ncbi:hypothetical protein BS50DRAFT_330296 [Corynespora cassiicola Philippines]|uniref:Uncharacterized protein n=1 Tax=Corynespora cassiicola Philippines TaxID=1448308 RepID=A0A2T2NUC2_CORCC|nr:hypothetical protein BS50DRAFT_330296 [Corynespora cassiicola Philippines]
MALVTSTGPPVDELRGHEHIWVGLCLQHSAQPPSSQRQVGLSRHTKIFSRQLLPALGIRTGLHSYELFSQRRRTKQRTMVSEGIVGSIVGTATWPLFLLILFTCSRWGVGGVQLSHVKLGCRYCAPSISRPPLRRICTQRSSRRNQWTTASPDFKRYSPNETDFISSKINHILILYQLHGGKKRKAPFLLTGQQTDTIVLNWFWW